MLYCPNLHRGRNVTIKPRPPLNFSVIRGRRGFFTRQHELRCPGGRGARRENWNESVIGAVEPSLPSVCFIKKTESSNPLVPRWELIRAPVHVWRWDEIMICTNIARPSPCKSHWHSHCSVCSYISHLPPSYKGDNSELKTPFPILKFVNFYWQAQVQSQIQVPNPKSKVQRKGNGTGADNIILQATTPPHPLITFLTWNVNLVMGKDHPWPSLTFHDLPWPSMTFYLLLWLNVYWQDLV